MYSLSIVILFYLETKLLLCLDFLEIQSYFFCIAILIFLTLSWQSNVTKLNAFLLKMFKECFEKLFPIKFHAEMLQNKLWLFKY